MKGCAVNTLFAGCVALTSPDKNPNRGLNHKHNTEKFQSDLPEMYFWSILALKFVGASG